MSPYLEFEHAGLRWTTTVPNPYTLGDRLGYLPSFLSAGDPRSAVEQLDSGYRQHGGWESSKRRMRFEPKTETLNYPGDPVLTQLARAQLRDEVILLFPHSWVVVVQSDGDYDVARLD